MDNLHSDAMDGLESRIVQEHNRRFEDRERVLFARLDLLEKSHNEIRSTVNQLETTVNVVKLEQIHLREMFDARLRIIERGQDLQLSKIDQLNMSITTIGSEPDKTPMGRQLRSEVNSMSASLDERGEEIRGLKVWQTQVDTVLAILKWVGAGGLVALGISILRLIKMIP